MEEKNFQDIDTESSLKALSRSRDAADIIPHIICTEVSLSPFTRCFHVNFTPCYFVPKVAICGLTGKVVL